MREGSREWSGRVKRSPAVLEVEGTQIHYTTEFRVHLLHELLDGRSATEVFRKAGLPPELIGGKRIERCASRVRESGRIGALLESEGDTWSYDATGGTDGDARLDCIVRAPERADDPWRVIMSMSYRINYLDERVRELERLLGGPIPNIAVGAAHGGGGE